MDAYQGSVISCDEDSLRWKAVLLPGELPWSLSEGHALDLGLGMC